MINSLTMENFTAFRKVKFEFVPGINVFVGANASGKTHAMKLLFTIQKTQFEKSVGDSDFADILDGTFRPESLRDLVRNTAFVTVATVTANWKGSQYSIEIVSDAEFDLNEDRAEWDRVTTPVFIPVKDMLAHSVGFLSLYDQRYVDFDETHRSILSLAFLPTLRESGRKDINPLLDKLADKMEGRVEVRGERFYIVGEKGRFEMHLVAEGWRKLALLYQLLANGSIARGTVLYWDEPEANLNPGIFPVVAEILASLAAMGTQLHIATHSYALLREIEFAAKLDGCTLRMFGLDRTEHGVQVEPVERFVDLKPNPILDEYERIYSLSVKEALQGGQSHIE